MLKMSPRSKMESPTCDYEKKTKTEKGHFKTLALSGQCNKELKILWFVRNIYYNVNYGILLKNINIYVITVVAKNWFLSYSSNKKQYVYLNNTASDVCSLNCEIP